MTELINLYGGPGTGKSTTAAHLFALLKQRGISAELVQEYAKGVVWEEHFRKLEDQLYILAKQNRHIARVYGKVEVVVTDSPILLSLVYGKHCARPFADMVRELHESRPSTNVFLRRVKKFDPLGRVQDEAKARALDEEIALMMGREIGIFLAVDADQRAAGTILEKVLS